MSNSKIRKIVILVEDLQECRDKIDQLRDQLSMPEYFPYADHNLLRSMYKHRAKIKQDIISMLK